MENFENKPLTTAAPTTNATSLEEQIDSLRHLVTSLLVLVVIISGAFNIYLWRQVKYLRQDVVAYQPQATAVVSEFEKLQPQMRDFLMRVQEFGRTHPSDPAFTAIMSKYRLDSVQFTNSAAAPSAQAPAKAAVPTKK